MHKDYRAIFFKQINKYETLIINSSTYYILAQAINIPCLYLYLLGPNGYETWCDKPAYEHRNSPIHYGNCRIGLYKKFDEKPYDLKVLQEHNNG